MKKQKWIFVLGTVCVSCCIAAGISACKKGGTKVENESVEYTYRNPDAVLPDYDTDVITVDGKLDEAVYSSLRWWDAAYPEDEGVNVRATAYSGEKGIFFIFDVDDYAVNVNPLRASWENSGVTVYVAKSDAVTLNDDVWEIELCPDNSINAKCYLGGYYYSTIQPDGYKNKPFVRTVTKGGAVNTDDCLGYVMESYFSYEYLFGSETKPDGFKINYSLQRNSNAEKNHSRDTYYNFGENLLGAYNWNSPSTWWSFNDKGLDSVILSASVTGSGKIEIADKFVSRYGSTSAKIIPDDGHRIKCVKFGDEDVTSQLKYNNGVNTLKLRNLADDCSLSVEFEAIPDGRSTISGNMTFKGSALTAQQAEELQVRVNIGGIVYTSDIDNSGSYTLNAANGKGTLEVVSKLGYSVKRESIEVNGNATKDIALTATDYGNNRVICIDDEAVITSKVKLFDASGYLDTMNGTFTYAFNLKYNGKLLDESGAAVDPTGGQYEHKYTSVNCYMTLKNAENANESLHLQLLCWDGQWILKASVGDKSKDSAVDNALLSELGSENGVNMLMVFADNGVSFYKTNGRGGVTQKILEINFADDFGMKSMERKLSAIDFYCENVVNHNIWAIENNVISLGKTINDYTVYEYFYNATATLTENSNTLKDALGLAWGDINHGGKEGGVVDSFKITSGNVGKDGAVSKDEQLLFVMLGCDEWSNRLNATLYLRKDGGSYFGMNLGPVTNTYDRYVLSDAQLKALGGDGLNVYLVQSADNTAYSLYVADGNNLVKVRDITSDGKGRAYGYNIEYSGTNTVKAVTRAFAGETADKLLARINDYDGTEYAQITEGTITHEVELINSTLLSGTYKEAHKNDIDSGTIIPEGEWDRGNSVWHYSVEASNFFNTDKTIARDLHIKFNLHGTSMWGFSWWQYNVEFKLDAANNKAVIIFQEGGPNWTEHPYELTADELNALAESGRLDFYAVRNHANSISMYIAGGDAVKSTGVTMPTASNFGVEKLWAEAFTEGAAVAVTCHNFYVDYNFDVMSAGNKTAQELIEATCSDDVAPDKVRYIQHVAAVEPGHTTPGNTEYWVLDGKYYSDAEATQEIELADTVIKPAGHNFDEEKWEYDLKEHWHVCTDDKAESEHAAHTPDGSGYCSVCGARPLGTLHKEEASEPTCTATGNKVYWTDGYYYFEDEAHTKPTTLSKVTIGALGHDYKYVSIDETAHKEQCSRCENVKEESQTAHSFTDGVCACGEKLQSKVKTFTGEKEETFGGYDDDNAPVTRFGPFNNGLARFTVKAPDAFGTDGNIKSAATMIMELKGCGEWYNHFGVKLNLNTSGSSISFVVNEKVISDASDYVLTKYQINALKTGGLEIFVETEGKKRFMYVKTSDSEISCVYRFTAGSNDNTIRNFRIIYAQAAYGAEVSYDVVDRGWNSVRDVIENNFDSAYTICWGEWNGTCSASSTGSISSGDIGSKSDNNFIHFNVKLDKQLATGECISLKYNGWSDSSFGVSTRLKFDGTKYVLSNCGLSNGSWVTFGSGVALTEEQSNKLVTDGLDFFYTQHGTDKFMSLYVYDGSSLTKLCDVCSQSNKPYSATASINSNDNDGEYAGEATATIKIDWFTYLPETTAEDAVKNYLGISTQNLLLI